MSKKEYKIKVQEFNNNDFVDNSNEWYYIEPATTQFENIFPRMINLTPSKTTFNVCDAGFGLGTMMYNFYIESKKFEDKTFNFFGVEKYKEYVDFFNKNLKGYWDNNIDLYVDDIMNHNYGKYDIVYCYAPFKNENDLMDMYQKIVDELKPNGILIEYAWYGKGFYSSIQKTHKNNPETTKLIRLITHNVLIKV